AEEADVRHENAGIDVDAMHRVQVDAAIRLREVAVSVIEVPLTAGRARVVARRHRRIHAELRHEASARVPGVKVATDAKLLDLHLAGTPALRRPHQGVVRRSIEIEDVRRIHAELTGEILRVQYRRVLAAVAVQPSEVADTLERETNDQDVHAASMTRT